MINERKELQWISFCSCFLITACVKVYVTMSANFCLANFVDVLLCQILFVFLSASCVYRGMRDRCAMGYLLRFIDSRIWWKMKPFPDEQVALFFLHLLIHSAFNLHVHLRFYTKVDIEDLSSVWCFTINYLFICTKWLLPFDWMMNELNFV